jgi:hypothetical protein
MSAKPARDEPEERAGLRREAWALVLIYASLAALPLLTGFACQGIP